MAAPVFYAHSIPDRPCSEWQPLKEHLSAVAEMARGFSEPFGLGDWAYLAGLWHDLGKYSKEFQERVGSMMKKCARWSPRGWFSRGREGIDDRICAN